MTDPAATPPLPGLEQAAAGAFTPCRQAGLDRLHTFLPRAGKTYARLRNHDFGPGRRDNVSTLSPWIRHRLVTEHEVLRATLARHTPSNAEKFVQEVVWRGYFKGWLEQRPTVWDSYRAGVDKGLEKLSRDTGLAMDHEAAVMGRTGIDAFDHWARELVETGYLHNHARMWFASIWIFTLRLPWELGADFFLRHLADGDPASNTLGWRWVGGLHTKGKTYLARASNIAKYTDGRFHPGHALAHQAEPLTEECEHPRQPLPPDDPMPEGDYLLLLTEEDGRVEELLPRPPTAMIALACPDARSPLAVGDVARAFASGAVTDAAGRAATAFGADEWHETG
ncbi:FAD-binding domain-containing protein, partial [Roseovarius salis]|uniref:FAD-binding domain-containing protein n=1 Tax=Roseovarius salis TaxID=3376063 RepID=UPI0037C805AD